MMITQKELKRRYDYDPISGDFTWKYSPRYGILAGDLVGHICNKSGYRIAALNRRPYAVHRLIWLWVTGNWPYQVDHENHDRACNIWANLKEVTHKENHKNMGKFKNNTSGFTGVCWDSDNNNWRAYIMVNGKKQHLGSFIEKKDAIFARKEANILHNFHPNHGDPI